MEQIKNISLPKVYNLANQAAEEMSLDTSATVQEISVGFATKMKAVTTELRRQLNGIHQRWLKRRVDAVELPVETYHELNQAFTPTKIQSENVRLLVGLMVIIRNEIGNCESTDYPFGIIVWDFKRIMDLLDEFDEILNGFKDLEPLDLPRTNRPSRKEGND